MEIHIGNRVAEIELVSKEDNKVVLTIDGKTFEADVVMAENGNCNILMDGRSSNAQLIRKENGKSYKVKYTLQQLQCRDYRQPGEIPAHAQER